MRHGGLLGHRGGCDGDQSPGRGSYEASRAIAKPPQSPTRAVTAALAPQGGAKVMNRCGKPSDHPYEGKRSDLVRRLFITAIFS